MDLDEALALPPIPSPASPLPHLDEACVITMDKAAITDAGAKLPVIANWGTTTCTVIFLYDRERKRLGAIHVSGMNEGVKRLVEEMKDNDPNRKLEAYITGGLPDPQFHSVHSFSEAREIVKFLASVPGVTLVHADLFSKNKSEDHAMDARTGEFFFLSEDRKSLTRRALISQIHDQKSEHPSQPFGLHCELVYDGRVPEGPHGSKYKSGRSGRDPHQL